MPAWKATTHLASGASSREHPKFNDLLLTRSIYDSLPDWFHGTLAGYRMTGAQRSVNVFLCHTSVDKPKVRALYCYLRKQGIKVWFDEVDLVVGQDWQVEIPKALIASNAIIICLTKNSVDKEGYIQNEIKFALDKALEMPEGHIFLIPVRIEECDVPYSLSRYQWVDLFDKAGYGRLMKALKFRAAALGRTAFLLQNNHLVEERLALEKDSQETEVHDTKPGIDQASHTNTWVAGMRSVGLPYVFGAVALAVVISAIGLWSFLREKSPPLGLTGTSTALVIPPTQLLSEIPLPSETPTEIIETVPTLLPAEILDSKAISMMLVPAGKFTMGRSSEQSLAMCQQIARINNNLICGSEGEYDERPVHEVYLSAFYIDKYEVTNAQYKLCVDAKVCDPPEGKGSTTRENYYGNSEFDDYPVISVNWTMARNYCEWRGAKLPTEARWEKAARGTDERTYPWGEGLYDCSKTNYANCKGDTTAVGSYETDKSPYGIYDLLGNVEEWMADWYSDAFYQSSPLSDPQGPPATHYRAIRGSDWSSLSFGIPSRWWDLPEYSAQYRGFRCARDPNP